MSDLAEYRFLPWAREGYQPTDPDQLNPTVSDASQLGVDVTLAGEGGGDGPGTDGASLDLRLYGPGDVLGFDRRQVVRMEPEPSTTDFTPNYFPTVEFDRADLPWLFSPAGADDRGRVRPWFALVVVRQQEGVSLGADETAPLPVLEIGGNADPTEELPDLAESWAWAHVQTVGGPSQGTDEAAWLESELREDSKKTVARLVAPRRLEADASYHACVVPTFEPGRRAGLGEEPYPEGSSSNGNGDSEDAGRDVAVAWNVADGPSSVRLPVYHSWQFSTGEAGDFESLVRALTPEVLDEVGYREVDASDPGVAALSADGPLDVRLEGALRAVGLDAGPYPDSWRSTLTALLEGDLGDGPGATADDALGPPAWGLRHAAQPDLGAASVDEETPWLYELNADPRHRVAAGFGASVVRENQEHLMGSAWEQVGEIRRANRLLRRAQLARAGNNAIYDRLAAESPAELLEATAPMHDRLYWPDADGSLAGHLDGTKLPRAALSPALRRIARPRGPVADRLPDGVDLSATALAEAANDPSFSFRSPGPPSGAADAGVEDGEHDSLVEEACRRVTDRANSAREARTEASLPDPEAVVEELLRTCRTVQRTVRAALDDLAESQPEAERALGAILEICGVVCGYPGESVEGTLLADAMEAVEREEPAAIVDAIDRIESAVDDAKGHVEALQALPAADRRGVSDDQVARIAGGCRTFEGTFEELLVAVAVPVLRYRCRTARKNLERAGKALAGTRQAKTVEELLLVCRAICGPSDDHGYLDELERALAERDYDAAGDAVAELRRLVAVAEPRLAALASDGEAADLPEVADAVAACESFERYLDLLAGWLDDLPADPVAERLTGVFCDRPEPSEPAPADVSESGLGDPLRAAVDPESTVPRRVAARVPGLPERDDPLDVVLAAPEFDRPTYEDLAEQSQEHLLPGVGTIAPESMGVVETNPAFVEAFVVGLNHEMARELRWREYPTDMRGTYFHRFWDRRGGVPPRTGDELHDVEELHEWPVRGETDSPATLGSNHLTDGDGQDKATSKVVLLVRSELLRRYPNTTIYAAEAVDPDEDGTRTPDLPTPETSTDQSAANKESVKFPQFRGKLDPDVTFLGFDLTADEARGSGSGDDIGWFFVFEEAPGEPRLGLDTSDEAAFGSPPDEWEDLTWQHLAPEGSAPGYATVTWSGDGSRGLDGSGKPVGTEGEGTATWGENGAHMAAITWQPPVRIGVHADDMLPPAGQDDGGSQ